VVIDLRGPQAFSLCCYLPLTVARKLRSLALSPLGRCVVRSRMKDAWWSMVIDLRGPRERTCIERQVILLTDRGIYGDVHQGNEEATWASKTMLAIASWYRLCSTMASRQLIPFTHRFSHQRSTGFFAAWQPGFSRVNPDVLLFTILQLHSRQPQHKLRASSRSLLHPHRPPTDIHLPFLASDKPDTSAYCSRSSRRLRHPCFNIPLHRI